MKDSYLNIIEFTKEELQEQLDKGIIDIDFLLEYIVARDRVYNKLINRMNELEGMLYNAEI